MFVPQFQAGRSTICTSGPAAVDDAAALLDVAVPPLLLLAAREAEPDAEDPPLFESAALTLPLLASSLSLAAREPRTPPRTAARMTQMAAVMPPIHHQVRREERATMCEVAKDERTGGCGAGFSPSWR